ncbi:MAG: hypothetical protein AB7N70_02600 [Dehalococcoidia bacterium]
MLSYTDVDLSTDLSAYPPVIEAIVSGAGVATGRRLGAGARVEQRRLLHEIVSRGYNLPIARAFRPHFTDAQCGFKAISREAAQRLLPRVENKDSGDSSVPDREPRLTFSDRRLMADARPMTPATGVDPRHAGPAAEHLHPRRR